MGEILSLQNEPNNSHDRFSVAVIKNSVVVGHVPKAVSRLIFYFLSRVGHTVVCEVIGNCLNRGANFGVEVPCFYRFYGCQRYIDRLNLTLHAS